MLESMVAPQGPSMVGQEAARVVPEVTLPQNEVRASPGLRAPTPAGVSQAPLLGQLELCVLREGAED